MIVLLLFWFTENLLGVRTIRPRLVAKSVFQVLWKAVH